MLTDDDCGRLGAGGGLLVESAGEGGGCELDLGTVGVSAAGVDAILAWIELGSGSEGEGAEDEDGVTELERSLAFHQATPAAAMMRTAIRKRGVELAMMSGMRRADRVGRYEFGERNRWLFLIRFRTTRPRCIRFTRRSPRFET
jgi:hypothetical protein